MRKAHDNKTVEPPWLYQRSYVIYLFFVSKPGTIGQCSHVVERAVHKTHKKKNLHRLVFCCMQVVLYNIPSCSHQSTHEDCARVCILLFFNVVFVFLFFTQTQIKVLFGKLATIVCKKQDIHSQFEFLTVDVRIVSSSMVVARVSSYRQSLRLQYYYNIAKVVCVACNMQNTKYCDQDYIKLFYCVLCFRLYDNFDK